MTVAGRRLAAGLCALVVAAGGASGRAQTGPQTGPLAGPEPTPAKHAYVDGFCLVIAGGYVDDDYARFLAEWRARPGSSAETDAARPQDAQAPGQLIHFPDTSGPVAIVEPRRDVCSLIFPKAAPSAAALTELSKDKPPVGPKGAPTPWRRVVPQARIGPPRPPKHILLVGGAEDRGVCAERFDDLRRHDGGVVSMLQLSPCRLAAGEKVVDG